jgi:hypothetical protein
MHRRRQRIVNLQAPIECVLRLATPGNALSIDLSPEKLERRFDLRMAPNAAETLSLTVEASLRRSGRILRFVQQG